LKSQVIVLALVRHCHNWFDSTQLKWT